MSSLRISAPFPYPFLYLLRADLPVQCLISPTTIMFDKLMATLFLCTCITCVYYYLNSAIQHFSQGVYLHIFFNILSTPSFVSLHSAETPSVPTYNLSTYCIPRSTCSVCNPCNAIINLFQRLPLPHCYFFYGCPVALNCNTQTKRKVLKTYFFVILNHSLSIL